MKKKLFFLLNILVPILIGTTYYILFCPDTFVTKWLFETMHLTAKPILLLDTSLWWAELLDGYLCDFLWAWSLTFLLVLILGTKKSSLLVACVIAMGFEIIMESLQMTSYVAGVFDIFDIVVECMATCVAILILIFTKLEGFKT